MFQYQRLNELFNYIYTQQIILPHDLAKQLNVSVRTIRSDINMINDELLHHGGQIVLKRNQGYFIEIENHHLFHQLMQQNHKNEISINLETPKSRIYYITQLLLLKNDYVSLDEIVDNVYVSYNTLQNYLRDMNYSLEKYNLELIHKTDSGVKIIGDEKSKRNYIIDSLQNTHKDNSMSTFSPEELYFFKDYDLNEIKSHIYQILSSHQIYINDMNTKNLVLHIALMVLRIDNENYINYIHMNDINNHFHLIINDIVQFLEETYGIYMSEGEKQYLYIHLASNTNCDIFEISDSKVFSIVERLLECIYQDYQFNLKDDVLLVEDLMKHLKSILSIKYLEVDKKNPLLNTIKSNFILPYEITLTSVKKVLDEYSFSEDDIGYISLHIGAAIERCFNNHYKTKNIILVCDGAFATARIMEAQIKNYFGNKLNIKSIQSCGQIDAFTCKDFENIDFIISTRSLHISYCPVVIINFALKTKDIEAISKMLNTIQTQDHQKGFRFFDNQLFILNQPYNNKLELLSDMTNMLLDNHIIDENFLESVLEREGLAKTNINDIFAFPHPLKYYANETKAVVALLNKPLKWHNNETVQIVFLLATKLDDQENIDNLYNIMIEIINNSSLQKKILKSNNYEEFIKCLPLL